MNLVDEQHVALFQTADYRGEVAGALDRRPRGRAHADLTLARDDMGERGLAQPRRPREEHVVEDLAALARRFDRHAEDFSRALLPDELAEHTRAQRKIERAVLLALARRRQPRRLGAGRGLFHL